MTTLSLTDLMGSLDESTSGEYRYSYKLAQDEFDWVMGQLDLTTTDTGAVVDNDEQDDNTPVGKYADGSFNTDIKLKDYVDIKLFRHLKESKHLKKGGDLDFRRLLGKATKKYQALLVQGTYAGPVAGDTAGAPTQADSPSN